MSFDLNRARKHLNDFEFSRLFIEELGWSNPSNRQAVPFEVKKEKFSRVPIAELSGVAVFEIPSERGAIPDAKTRAAVYKEVSAHHHENVLIFIDRQRSQSLWYWAKRQDSKVLPRDHIFMRGQPGDLFLSKLSGIHFDLSDFDFEGNVPLVQVTGRLKEALDVERVTKRFYTEFQQQHIVFLELIEGIDDEHDRRWYASVLLNRLMFIYFLQRKLFLDKGDSSYLQNKLAFTRESGRDLYYEKFLKVMFFEGFAKPEDRRPPEANKLLGKIRYLNGGLFLLHSIEQRWAKIRIPDKAFQNLFALFERYSWNLDDTPGGQDNEINPDVLGYIFEKYINQKAFGAYYTRPEITEYLCERTIHALILDGINTKGVPGVVPPRQFASIGDLLINLDAALCRKLIYEVLPNLRLLDPACGSAAFLVAAMRILINIYAAVIGKIRFLNDTGLSSWLSQVERGHPSVNYYIKKMIITENLFGVDIMEEAVEIAKLRLFLALVAAANTVDDLEPLPNIDFNILSGNSLIGLMRVDDKDFEDRTADLFRKSYRQVLVEKNRMVQLFRKTTTYAEDLSSLRDHIDEKKQEAFATLNAILLSEFNSKLKIKFEQATWDVKKNVEGKSAKRHLAIKDIEAMKPFHWGFEFDEIINQQGGFDAIITNPPWEVFKPNGKEFLEQFSDLITKKKMTIKDFEKEQAKLLKDPDIREAWLKYLSEYPYVSEFFRSTQQFRNQISVVNGKKAGTDINLYKLFTEQCFNLLRSGGYCGIVIPSGIYTDLGTKQLREMLFAQAKVTGLFCIENRKNVFENVDCRFKFVVLTFEKGNSTQSFPAAFMRHDVAELDRFPQEGAIDISVELVRRLSPDSLSVMEFKNEMDVGIIEKMTQFPRLGEDISDSWRFELGNEFHMTGDSKIFKTEPGKGRLLLYEGKMIWQFDHKLSGPRYWVAEREGRKALLGREKDNGQELGYKSYRLGHRSIASSTNERTMIATILPPAVFFGHSINATRSLLSADVMLYITAVLNSFVYDFALRSSVSANLTMFFVYQLCVPRPAESDAAFWPIVKRAARLICTTPEFDALAKEVGMKNHKEGAPDPVERAKLRAELDGLIARLYGLTDDEFAHILKTFPLVPEPVRAAALDAYRDVGKGKVK